MALFRAFSLVKTAVLSNVRVPINYNVAVGLTAPVSLKFTRGFAEGTYLDKNDVTERVLHIVKNFEKVDPGKVSPASAFASDLGLDSLDVVELVMAIEEEFAVEIPDSEADKILSCTDAISYIASHPMAK